MHQPLIFKSELESSAFRLAAGVPENVFMKQKTHLSDVYLNTGSELHVDDKYRLYLFETQLL